jgi:hypothetical protein
MTKFKCEVLQGYYYEMEILKRKGFAVTSECVADLREEGQYTAKITGDRVILKNKKTKESLDCPFVK